MFTVSYDVKKLDKPFNTSCVVLNDCACDTTLFLRQLFLMIQNIKSLLFLLLTLDFSNKKI